MAWLWLAGSLVLALGPALGSRIGGSRGRGRGRVASRKGISSANLENRVVFLGNSWAHGKSFEGFEFVCFPSVVTGDKRLKYQ